VDEETRPAARPRFVLPLRTWLVFSHLAVLTFPILAVMATGALAYDLKMQTKGELINQGHLVGLIIHTELHYARQIDPDAGLGTIGERLSPRLVQARHQTLASYRVIDAEGRVMASSGSQLGEDLSDLPEVREALAGAAMTIQRPKRDPATDQPLSSPARRAKVRIFQTVPVFDESDEELVAVVLLSRTPREEVQALYQMSPRLSLGALVALILTLGMSWRWATLGTRSLQRLAEAARNAAAGHEGAADSIEGVHDSHIAEVADVARSYAATTRQLQDRLGYIAEFAGSVSHEFKTPIATLRGTLELLQDDEGMAPEQRARFMANAEAELQRLERLVTGLLRLARAEELQTREDVPLIQLLNRARSRYPELQVVGSPSCVSGNPEQLETVLNNLVENGLSYGKVELRGFTRGNWTGFEVTDDGPGISDANQKRIFDRFFTTRRKSGGTGLGLALVKTVVQSHGGLVRVDSRPGRTVFTVELPRSEQPPEA
jgi:signal transduction histidine kinase